MDKAEENNEEHGENAAVKVYCTGRQVKGINQMHHEYKQHYYYCTVNIIAACPLPRLE